MNGPGFIVVPVSGDETVSVDDVAAEVLARLHPFVGHVVDHPVEVLFIARHISGRIEEGARRAPDDDDAGTDNHNRRV